MAKPYHWVEIPRPETKDDWHGHVRHSTNREWVNGTEESDTAYDVWERLEATFKKGDRVVLNGGMGDYDLGTYLGIVSGSGMAGVRVDGYEEPDGTRHEPYEMAINFDALSKPSPQMESMDDTRMLPGYKRIKAEMD